MATANVPFDKRLRRIVRRHQRMSYGVVRRVQPDGLIVARPRVYNPHFPLRGMLLLVLAVFLFKGFVYADLGGVTYNDRVSQLSNGTLLEQAGGWAMQADRVTLFVANVLKDVVP